MLEIKNLTKVYRPKKGQPVKALDGVSLLLPEKGMVFLLGKSGSGKSTLLNLLGGLDKYDGGEILIKGEPTRSFRQKHFDSYRNTYVGFVFQEYNLLDEFTVGANIALALRLQGKKASNERINEILQQVDLAGFGSRKPNELSGGQKQRVAIARALVKNPDIIMADEPTGALDSTTGRQVLETLKKLSGDKLVIVVSHDREFAENYADRIIELADGRVISDMEYGQNTAKEITFTGDSVQIPPAYQLTAEDLRQINEYIAAREKGITLALGKRGGRPTDLGKIRRHYSGGIKLIRSKLPMSHAFKMGSTALRYKKIRLTITILLSCIAFGLFGLADTFGAYDHIGTCTDSLIDSGINYAAITKEVRLERGKEIYHLGRMELTEGDLRQVKLETGVEMRGVYLPREDGLDFVEHYDAEKQFTETNFHIYAPFFNGFCEFGKEDLEHYGYQLLAGRLPDGSKNEIAITEYVARTFMIGGYRRNEQTSEFAPIRSAEQMVGKWLTLGDTEYVITGIVDTGMDIERYQPLTVASEAPKTTAEELLDYALERELSYLKNFSLHQSALVGEGKVAELIAAAPSTYRTDMGHLSIYNENEGTGAAYIGTLEDNGNADIVWLAKERSTLAKNEIVVASDCFNGTDFIDAPDSFMGRWDDYFGESEELSSVSIVGYIDAEKYPQYSRSMLVNEALMEGVVYEGNGRYSFAVGNLPTERADIKALNRFCYEREGEVKYPMMNAVTYQLNTVNEVLVVLSDIFLYIGLGFALFAALLLSNFISVSITYKKREIGILRAIGSRSADVFRIFFSESFIIAMINFVLSATGVGLATAVINYVVRANSGLYLTVLTFGVRQVALLLVLSCLVAAVASFLPVRRIAAKRPIDAIRSN